MNVHPAENDTLEFVVESAGNAFVRVEDQIIDSPMNFPDVAKLLKEVQADEAGISNRFRSRARDHFSRKTRFAHATPQSPSILSSILSSRDSLTILSRGTNARCLAKAIASGWATTTILELPYPPSEIVDKMSAEYRRRDGFPTVPLWQPTFGSEAAEWEDVRRAIFGRRLILLAAERMAFWELDHLLQLTNIEGPAVLPITFSKHRVLIGPLILGGSAIAFYLSRLGPGITGGHTAASAKLLCMSQSFTGRQTDLISSVALQGCMSLSDELCVSVLEIRSDANIVENEIEHRWKILDCRLKGSTWSLSELMQPSIKADLHSWRTAERHIQQGGILSIGSAFRTDSANALHESLEANDKWRLHEEIHPFFFYHHHNIYNIAELSATMLVVSLIFSSQSTVDWAELLLGSDCDGFVQQSASWYMPGDHSTPHSDSAARRKLAFVWHLTKNWDISWGGHLVFLRSDKILPVGFNTLTLFDTRKSGRHFVMQVAPSASGKRLAWNGWWTSREFEDDVHGKTTDLEDAHSGRFRFV